MAFLLILKVEKMENVVRIDFACEKSSFDTEERKCNAFAVAWHSGHVPELHKKTKIKTDHE